MVADYQNPLRLNVGFIIHETVGYFRDFEFDFPELNLQDELSLTHVTGVVRVTRTAQGLLVQVKMQGVTEGECSRCLTEIQQPLEVDFTELYAFSPDQQTESGLMVPETGKIDLAPLIRDEFLLSIPLNSLCKPDCKGLCPVCGENLNETDCGHAEPSIDPRLSDLKKLLEKKI
jgi:uncharacterized protein